MVEANKRPPDVVPIREQHKMVGETSSGDHYFTSSPTVDSSPTDVDLLLPDLSVQLRADRGVFSQGSIDTGTRLLLMEAPTPDPNLKHVLDLGCGYGPIALTLAHRTSGAVVWAIDVNTRALELCAGNAERAGFDQVRPMEPDDVPADVRFDLIWSNPPIRIGKSALHELLESWLDRLTPNGRGVLVVQRHLGADSLSKWLNAQGWPTEKLLSRSGYRLLDVRSRTEPT